MLAQDNLDGDFAFIHACLQEIHIAEIDGDVPEVSKKYFPGMAVGFNDPRVKVHICDGIK
jgi:spermidine synthase